MIRPSSMLWKILVSWRILAVASAAALALHYVADVPLLAAATPMGVLVGLTAVALSR